MALGLLVSGVPVYFAFVKGSQTAAFRPLRELLGEYPLLMNNNHTPYF